MTSTRNADQLIAEMKQFDTIMGVVFLEVDDYVDHLRSAKMHHESTANSYLERQKKDVAELIRRGEENAALPYLWKPDPINGIIDTTMSLIDELGGCAARLQLLLENRKKQTIAVMRDHEAQEHLNQLKHRFLQTQPVIRETLEEANRKKQVEHIYALADACDLLDQKITMIDEKSAQVSACTAEFNAALRQQHENISADISALITQVEKQKTVLMDKMAKVREIRAQQSAATEANNKHIQDQLALSEQSARLYESLNRSVLWFKEEMESKQHRIEETERFHRLKSEAIALLTTTLNRISSRGRFYNFFMEQYKTTRKTTALSAAIAQLDAVTHLNGLKVALDALSKNNDLLDSRSVFSQVRSDYLDCLVIGGWMKYESGLKTALNQFITQNQLQVAQVPVSRFGVV